MTAKDTDDHKAHAGANTYFMPGALVRRRGAEALYANTRVTGVNSSTGASIATLRRAALPGAQS